MSKESKLAEKIEELRLKLNLMIENNEDEVS